MRSCFLKFCTLLLCICMVLPLIGPVSAEETQAADITADTVITSTCFANTDFLHDGDIKAYKTAGGSGTITLQNSDGIAGLYLMFDLEYGAYTVTDDANGNVIPAGQYGFLHEFLDLDTAFGYCPTSVTLEFADGSPRLSEIYAFSAGQTPDFVQRWDAPLEGGADLVLFATHGDDDQLYFAGLLPYYAGQLEYRVQVVYLTDHRNNTKKRTHEMLNGLWNVGVTAYPVFGRFADFRIDDLQETYDEYRITYDTTEQDLQAFVVEQIRRFRPLVVVGHDINGEYGHGMHMVYADLLIKALQISGDDSQFPASAEAYGVWEIPKLYLHLYSENQVVMDYDQPLDRFDGLTAFQVTQQLGFPCHETQQWTGFVNWLYGKQNQITKASQISKYSPCLFGLYHTTVGEDVQKNDLFENIITYAEQELREQERLEQERLEQERLEQERLEQKRLEQERLEQERLEQERLEQERLEQERLEQERLEQERLQQERLEQKRLAAQRRKKEFSIAIAVLIVLIFLLCVVLIRVFKGRKRKNI